MSIELTALRVACLSLVALGLTALPATTASAAPLEQFHYDEVGSFDFTICGTIPVHVDQTQSGLVRVVTAGPAGYPTYLVETQGTVVMTNKATGRAVRLVAHFWEHDIRATDNGDGTYTLLVNGPIHEKDYNPDGSLAFMTTGVQRYEIVLDTMGTADFADDEFVADNSLPGHLGRDDRAGTAYCDWFAEVTA